MNRHPLALALALPVLASSAWAQTTLKEAAAKAGLNIGIATNSFQVNNATSAYSQAAAQHFNMVVCENEMKFESTENPIGSFKYNGGDGVYNFAKANGMRMRGHTFIWHSQSSSAQSAVRDRQTGLTVMRNHIEAVGGHFKEKIYEWDVLNEITADGSGGLRGSFWKNNIGEDFCDSALAISRRVIGTNGYLYYNDYGADGVNSKSTSMFNLVKHWQQNKVPIDGIGLQSHLGTGIRKDDISANIKRFGDLGIRISTEIDITSSKVQDWVNLMNACLENFNCVSFVTWGLSDNNSWLGSRCNGCLLFSGTATPKTDIINALIEALNNADPTIVAKRKEFAARPPGGTTPIRIALPAVRKAPVGMLGTYGVPVFSNGAKAIDALGRNLVITPLAPEIGNAGSLPR